MLVDAALGGKLHPLLLLTLVAKPNLQKAEVLEMQNSKIKNTSFAD